MGLDPGIRQQKVKDWFGTAAKVRFEALIAKDPKRALEMFGVGMPVSGKGDRVGRQTPDEILAQAFRDDLPQPEQAALTRQAEVAHAAQQVELRTDIGLAEQNAPDAIASTGAYSGKMPGRDAFRIAYGLDEGDQHFRDFDWRADVGRQVFGMRTMPNQAIHAALRDADSGRNGSQEDQTRREATAAAVGLVMNHRRADGGGYVSEVFSNVGGAWKAVIGGGLEDPNGYDKDAYDKAIAMSVAGQEQLGIENPQPVPRAIIRDLSDNYDSPSAYQQEINARVSGLLAGTSGPVARASVARQLADAGLGWIIPDASGYKAPSTRSVVESQLKALGKTVANAGIGAAEFAAKVVTMAADGNTQATLSSPDFTGAYYDPSNRVENLMMHQGYDALGWSIPWPGAGRAAVAEKGITRAVDPTSAIAAGRAERLIANKSGSELASEAGTGAIRAPTGQFYSVMHEMRLDPSLYPGSLRPVHVQAANESLLQTMEGEIAFAQDLLNQGLNLQRTPTGLAPRAAPLGFSWHHADEPSVMQLVPRSQHDGGTIFQKTLHPNGRGGFSLWGKK
ncbi:HNH endonuclease, partial [Mesorhizobium sp. M7A.F.Ca.US.003.02.1.1]